MGLRRKVLAFTCMGALALAVGCPGRKINSNMDDKPSPSEYLYDEKKDEFDGVVYQVYADPEQKRCRVDFFYIIGNDLGAEPRRSMMTYLINCCELELFPENFE